MGSKAGWCSAWAPWRVLKSHIAKVRMWFSMLKVHHVKIDGIFMQIKKWTTCIGIEFYKLMKMYSLNNKKKTMWSRYHVHRILERRFSNINSHNWVIVKWKHCLVNDYTVSIFIPKMYFFIYFPNLLPSSISTRWVFNIDWHVRSLE